MPQGASAQSAVHQASGHSWILPEASTEDLLYVAGEETYLYSWPNGKAVGEIDTTGVVMCSDTNGNVWYLNGNKASEYAHAGSYPIETLTVPGMEAVACAVDPKTGNLAVATYGSSIDGGIAIYTDAEGQPTLYDSLITPTGLGYDDAGNLFVSGYDWPPTWSVTELPSGSSTFVALTVNQKGQKFNNLGPILWDGQYMSLEGNMPTYGPAKEFQLNVSGSTATVVRTTVYKSVARGGYYAWIQGGYIAIPYRGTHSLSYAVGIWKYPGRGSPLQVIKRFGGSKGYGIESVTVSVAPSRSRK